MRKMGSRIRRGICIVPLLLLHTVGCSFSGKALTTSGFDAEPHMVFNGSHFGIVYYHRTQSLGWPSVDLVKVAKDGSTLAAKSGAGAISHLYVPYRLSELVWNQDNQQFAFAYTKDKVIHFVRLDSSLNPLGSPLIIKFGLPASSYEHPTLVDLSLVWNAVKKEYGLTFVTVEHPYLQERHDDIYISRISPAGSYVGTYERLHIVTCPGDCEKTSLTYNTDTGQYALSYFKNDFPKSEVMLGLLSATGNVTEHKMMSGWNTNDKGEETHVHFDPRTGEYFVVALKRKSGLTGNELSYQLASSSGTPKGSYFAWSIGQGFDNLVSASNYLEPTANVYLLCAAEQGQIHCWMANAKGHVKTDLATTAASANSWGPALVVGDRMYLSWIEDGTLKFGDAKLK